MYETTEVGQTCFGQARTVEDLFGDRPIPLRPAMSANDASQDVTFHLNHQGKASPISFFLKVNLKHMKL